MELLYDDFAQNKNKYEYKNKFFKLWYSVINMIKLNHDKSPPWVLFNPKYISIKNAVAYALKLINSRNTGKNLYVRY